LPSLPPVAAKEAGGEGVSHKAKQTPPIQLGTSGGWRYDLANAYCCGGTLGSLVTDGSKQYILSNFHVFAADVDSGGNNLVAQVGDPIIQPGLIDVGCTQENAQNVATLYDWADPLTGTNIDAAIAEVTPGMVRRGWRHPRNRRDLERNAATVTQPSREEERPDQCSDAE